MREESREIDNNNKKVKSVIRMLGKRIEHLHFSDNDGCGDDHLAIGKGHIDYEMVVNELKRVGYGRDGNGTITFETFNSGDRGFKSSVKRIRTFWGDH